jgi:hypothetical protein
MQVFLILLVRDVVLIHHAIVIVVITRADFQPFSISYISHLYSRIMFNMTSHFKVLLKYARCVQYSQKS